MERQLRTDFSSSVAVFAAQCAMCCGLCGKLSFIIMLGLWAGDVTGVVLRLHRFLPLKAATARQDKQVVGLCVAVSKLFEFKVFYTQSLLLLGCII